MLKYESTDCVQVIYHSLHGCSCTAEVATSLSSLVCQNVILFVVLGPHLLMESCFADHPDVTGQVVLIFSVLRKMLVTMRR